MVEGSTVGMDFSGGPPPVGVDSAELDSPVVRELSYIEHCSNFFCVVSSPLH